MMPRRTQQVKFTIRLLAPDLWRALEDLFGENGEVSRLR